MSTGWTDADLHARDPLRGLAARLGCSTGQAWTLTGGVVLGVALLTASVVRGPGVAQEGAGGLALPPPLAPLPVAAVAEPAAPVATAAPDETAPDGTAPDLPAPALPSAPDLSVPPAVAVPPAAAPSPSTAPGPTSAPSPSSTPDAGPLRILAGGWTAADSTRGDARGFPDTDFPISADSFGESRHSFVRLTGTGLRLVLRVDPTAGATAGTPRLQACPTSTAAWRPGPAQPSAPPYADAPCAPGRPSVDGSTWTFDLSALPDPGNAAGISLVPASADPTTSLAPFQIAFLPDPGATS